MRERFRGLADQVLDALLETAPEWATRVGEPGYDDRLTDWTPMGVEYRVGLLTDAVAALDDVDDTALDLDERIDLELLRTAVSRDLWLVDELAEHERNPLLHLPAVPLIGFPGRMALLPQRLAAAQGMLQDRWDDVPRVQAEAAVEQAAALARTLRAAPAGGDEPERAAAIGALEDFARWAERGLPDADGEWRLGPQRFAATLWYGLDTQVLPEVLLTRAESDLQGVEEELAEVAARLGGAPGELLAQRPAPGPATVPVGPDHHAGPGAAVSRVRAACASEVFTLGWAAHLGERQAREQGDAALLRALGQRLRWTIHAILDVRAHTRAMTEEEALALLVGRGHLTATEAAQTWRTAQLTSTQLSTRYVGHRELTDLVRVLRDARPQASPSDLDGEVLAHGAPPPRHLLTLLGLD